MKDWTLDYFVERAVDWQTKAFNGEGMDPKTRAFKVLEEAVELCQAVGVPIEKAHEQVDRKYAGEIGDPVQEFAGTLFCTLLTAPALGIQAGYELNKEIISAYNRIDLIREKSKHKVKL